MVRFVERIALGPRRCERVHRERVAEWIAARSGAWAHRHLLHQPHLDLIGAEAQPVAIAQTAHVAVADRIALAVEERPVGRGVGDLPGPATECHGEMAFGEQSLRIGQHPINTGATPDGEFAAGHGAGLGGHRVGAAQDR